jgi:hypothetical protein
MIAQTTPDDEVEEVFNTFPVFYYSTFPITCQRCQKTFPYQAYLPIPDSLADKLDEVLEEVQLQVAMLQTFLASPSCQESCPSCDERSTFQSGEQKDHWHYGPAQTHEGCGAN